MFEDNRICLNKICLNRPLFGSPFQHKIHDFLWLGGHSFLTSTKKVENSDLSSLSQHPQPSEFDLTHPSLSGLTHSPDETGYEAQARKKKSKLGKLCYIHKAKVFDHTQSYYSH